MSGQPHGPLPAFDTVPPMGTSLWILMTTAAVAVLLYADASDNFPLKALSKATASVGFMGTAVAQGALDSGYGIAVLVGLGLSLLGDLFLLRREDLWFLAGLGSFLLAHLTYSVAFFRFGVNWTWAGLALLPLAGLLALLAPRIVRGAPSELRAPVVVYITVITAMVALAAGAVGAGGHRLMLVGAFAFMVSDVAVAEDQFIQSRFLNRLWGLPLYYGSQLCLAWTVGEFGPQCVNAVLGLA